MTQPLGIDDFFALEAGEYLERLATLVSGGTAPRPEELVRYARALRGSALMANQHVIARAAGGMEHVLRAYRDGRRPWDMETATLVASAVDELRDLVSHVTHWTPDHTGRAERLAARLEGLAGPSAGGASATSDAGVRAFLAREAATVASALDQAARAVRASGSGHEPMQGVLRRMQPLRGLAALSDFPPLAEILDGVERSSATLEGSATGLLAELLDAGAHALARAARDVAEHGKPDPEAAECRRFAEVLRKAEPPNAAVVPIESLFFDGEPGVISRGTEPQPAPRVAVGGAELVSRGEHLCQVADELERANSPTMQSLRLHSLTGALGGLASDVGDGALAQALDGFANAARTAIADGTAIARYRQFAIILRQAGSRLRGATEPAGTHGLAEAIGALTADLRGPAIPAAAAPPTPAPAAVPAPAPPPKAPPTPEPRAAEPIVPIEALAPDDEEVSPLGAAGLMGSLMTYHRLLADGADGIPSLETLMRGPAAAPPAPAPVVVAPVVIVPVVIAPVVIAPVAVVPVVEVAPVLEIAELCYRGRSALTRAAAVRLEIRDAMASHAAGAVLRPLVEELLDLVELAQVD